MKFIELYKQMSELLDNHPNIVDAELLIDTCAATFNVHMVSLESMYYDEEACKAMDKKFLSIHPDMKDAKL